MSRLWRLPLILLLGAALWPEFPRHLAEWRLREANLQVEGALAAVQEAARQGRGADVAQIRQQAQTGLELAARASTALPGDARVTLVQAVGLILAGKGREAATLLEAAIATRERPEFSINLGRARTTLGDTAAAEAAYLRTAWASSQAISTLPQPLREELQRQVVLLEAQLHAGTLQAAPPLHPTATP